MVVVLTIMVITTIIITVVIIIIRNDGMECHRKMHINNKRKGDDPSKLYTKCQIQKTSQVKYYSLCKDQHGCRFLQRQD